MTDTTTTTAANDYGSAETAHARFTRFLLDAGALRFGDFTLKSGRRSPYFINAGAFDTGALVARLGEFYAQRVLAARESGEIHGDIDTIFGQIGRASCRERV